MTLHALLLGGLPLVLMWLWRAVLSLMCWVFLLIRLWKFCGLGNLWLAVCMILLLTASRSPWTLTLLPPDPWMRLRDCVVNLTV